MENPNDNSDHGRSLKRRTQMMRRIIVAKRRSRIQKSKKGRRIFTSDVEKSSHALRILGVKEKVQETDTQQRKIQSQFRCWGEYQETQMTIINSSNTTQLQVYSSVNGVVAHMVERFFSMEEVRGSIPRNSKLNFSKLWWIFRSVWFRSTQWPHQLLLMVHSSSSWWLC